MNRLIELCRVTERRINYWTKKCVLNPNNSTYSTNLESTVIRFTKYRNLLFVKYNRKFN